MAKQAFDILAMAPVFEAIREVQLNTVDVLERIAERDNALRDAKNTADAAKTVQSDLWVDVMAVTEAVFHATERQPDARDMVISAVMRQFLHVEKGAKRSTAGQYASTARKLLEFVTANKLEISEFMGMKRSAIMEAMRDKAHAALLEAVNDAAKKGRYIAKHGTTEERKALEALLVDMERIAAPIRARRDGEKAASVGQRELAELKQQHPSVPTVIETVTAAVSGEGEEPAAKVAVA